MHSCQQKAKWSQIHVETLYREKWREDSNIPKHVVLQVWATPKIQGHSRQATAASKAVTEFQQTSSISLFILILWVLLFSFLHLSHPFWGVYSSLNMNLEKVLSGFMIVYLSNIEIKAVTVLAHEKWVSSPHPLEGPQVWEGPCDTHSRCYIL